MSRNFATRLRAREKIVGYWTQVPVPAVQERLARQGWDYICFDAQHGLHDQHSVLNGLIAVDAGAALGGHDCAGMVRVAANDTALIGLALDAGARGVIVPLVDNPADARRAVEACRYPRAGGRSFGPVRAGLRSGPDTHEMNSEVACIVMIETAGALECVEELARTPGLDGLYIGPADLMLAIGGRHATDPALIAEFEAALARINAACAAAGIASGIHTIAGGVAKKRLEQGFTFATVSSDLNHIDLVARSHLADAM